MAEQGRANDPTRYEHQLPSLRLGLLGLERVQREWERCRIIDDANRIVVGDSACLTYEEAKELAESMNKTKLFSREMLRLIKGTAKEIRT